MFERTFESLTKWLYVGLGLVAFGGTAWFCFATAGSLVAAAIVFLVLAPVAALALHLAAPLVFGAALAGATLGTLMGRRSRA